jgi:hypothetical protein
MVNVAPIKALDHKRAGVPKVLAHFKSLLVDVLCGEIFSDAAVVCVAQFCPVKSIIKQVVNIDIVYISLYFFQVHFVIRGLRFVLFLLLLGVRFRLVVRVL